MDIDILNSGTPNSKNFLNIVCNSITCNEVIAPPFPASTSAFNLYRSAAVSIPPTNISAPCNLVGIPNVDVDLLTNTYTAPRDGFLSVSFSIVVNWAPTALSMQGFVYVGINGTPTYLFANYRNDNLGATTGSLPLQISGILQVNAGDVVGVELSFNGTGSGFSYSSTTFSGQLI